MTARTSRQLGVAGVGPQRTASTWLYTCLNSHPALCFPRGVKETFFFGANWDRGWDWYWSHFRGCRDGAVPAEIAPTYFDRARAPERLFEHNPECKILVGLRDSVDRCISLWMHHRKKGRVGDDFADAVQKMPRIVDSGRYAAHLPRWIDRFGREQVHLMFVQDLAEEPEEVLVRVYDFLGVKVPEDLPDAVNARVNSATMSRFPWLARWATRGARWLRERKLHPVVEFGKSLGLRAVYRGGVTDGTVSDGMKRELADEFEEDIRFVESVTGRSLAHWRRD